MECIEVKVRKETAKKRGNVSPKLRTHLQESFEKQIDDRDRQSKLIRFEGLLERIIPGTFWFGRFDAMKKWFILFRRNRPKSSVLGIVNKLRLMDLQKKFSRKS